VGGPWERSAPISAVRPPHSPCSVPESVSIREVGPLVVTWYDDGSVWAYGMPPLRDLVRLDTRPGRLRLTGFARLCDRVNACDTADELSQLAAQIETEHAADPCALNLRQWLEHRAQMLARA
jgi:hypothetical protein